VGDLTARLREMVAQLTGGDTSPAAPPPPPAATRQAGPPPAPVEVTTRSDRSRAPAPPPAEVARVLGLPLDRLDRMVEVRMAWCPVSLWFVPDEPAADALRAEDVPRGRIWTVHELLALLRTPDLTKAGTRTRALAKLEFDGELTEVRRPG
jgi:hypothetical protein